MRFTEQRAAATDRQELAYHEGGSERRAHPPGSLIVVSNRQPYRHEYAEGTDQPDERDGNETGAAVEGEERITVEEPAGGLTGGLDPVLREAGGTWIAWGDGGADRAVAAEDGTVAVPPGEESYTLRRLWLSEAAVDGYYYGFSNRVLWPLCHEFPDLIEHRSRDLAWYRRVNDRFAEAAAEHATDDSVIWLQDYHLGFAPATIREMVPSSVTVAQFWHVPWPDPEVFGSCPAREELLRGLLGNDLLGFHVRRYADRFLECVDRFVPEAAVDRGRGSVRHDGRRTRVVATPMGIDAASHDDQARAVDPDRWESLREEYGIPAGATIGLGVDRLDYSKGIPERLAAVERLLERDPGRRGEFTFVQKATPSRTDVPAYQRLGERVRSEVRRINERFGTDEWRPIVYTEDYLSREDLCACFRRADVMVVSPLLDGMNLVAQEFLASNVDGDGALVLSDRAGAHELLGDLAYTIDPTDTDDFAETIAAALSAPAAEHRRRMDGLRDRIFANDLETWMETQFEYIGRIHERSWTELEDASGSPPRGPL